MTRSFAKIAWILLYALVLAGSSGFATCGGDEPDDEAVDENRGGETDQEMMDDAIRDSDR